MKKCLLCFMANEASQPTCTACGEATWEMIEEPVLEAAPEPEATPEPRKKSRK
jgi:hypothetical protein